MGTAKSASFCVWKAGGSITKRLSASGAKKDFSCRTGHKKRKRLYHRDYSVIRLRPHYANHIWSIDFVHDRLSNGRPYKMLTVLDEYTRETLSVTVGTKMGANEVLEALYPLLLKRGKPAYLCSDNGPEFSAAPFQDWLRRVGITLMQINPGSPWEDSYNARQWHPTPGGTEC
jgi:transposase InsO family protein